MTRNVQLAFVTREPFSFDPFDLHHNAVLHDHRHLAKLQARKRLSNMFDLSESDDSVAGLSDIASLLSNRYPPNFKSRTQA